MMSPKPRIVSLPGRSGREIWRRADDGAWEREGRDQGTGGLFAIEALALESVPFWAVASHDGPQDIDRVAALRREGMGIESDAYGKSCMQWQAGTAEGRILVASVGLARGFDTAIAESRPDAFEITPRLYPIPHDEAAIWMELGRHVIAFMRGASLVHFTVLGARALDREAVREVRDLLMALRVNGILTQPIGLRVWSDAPDEFCRELENEIGVPVRLEDQPEPRLPDDACVLLPPEIAAARGEQRIRRRRSRSLMTVAAVYVIFFATWTGWLSWREHRLSAQRRELDPLRPQAEEVRALRTRWETLERATDPDSYPAELFHRVASLLPDEGICLKEFRLDQEKLVVSGEASTVAHAKKFQADLTGNEALRQFRWNFPQPQVLQDNRANFRAEGSFAAADPAP